MKTFQIALLTSICQLIQFHFDESVMRASSAVLNPMKKISPEIPFRFLINDDVLVVVPVNVCHVLVVIADRVMGMGL
jgi:hypothetical protein